MVEISGFADLPEDVMPEILARLPVKSLLRFKCVRKSWYALIKKNPTFISKHLNCASSNDDNARIALKHCKIIPTDESRVVWIRKPFISFFSNTASVEFSHEIASPFFNDDDDASSSNHLIFYGHCNGIICSFPFPGNSYATGDPITLWNPATREFKTLYVPSFTYRDDAIVYFLALGFGFDNRSNDYKVIRIINFTQRRAPQIFDPVVEVYNSSTDSWRKIVAELPKKIQFRTGSSTYLNGFCYWLAYEIYKEMFVLSFDFAAELFEKIALPSSNTVSTLLKLNETIAVIERKGVVYDDIAVWVLNMNGDGEKKTWTKLYNIPFDHWVCVVGFLKSGEALINHHGDKFALYDPSTQQCKNLRDYYSDSVCDSFQMVDYVESLVSFKAD